MDEITHRRLQEYLAVVRNLPNESAKTHRFMGLLGELFPGSSAVARISEGTEKTVRVDLGKRTKTGRIDAYYGNAIIEFERSLRATESVALKQLREYAAGVWKTAKGSARPLLCIASDGIVWKVFRPRVRRGAAGKLLPSDIGLEVMREIMLSEETLPDFWIWLTSLLFRDTEVEPTAERFCVDFGAQSPAFADAMDALRQAWGRVGSQSEARLAFKTWKNYLTVTYGGLGKQLEPLFLKHTYLASVARLLVWSALSRGKVEATLRETAAAVLSGEYFRCERIENMVEDDFFQWVRRPMAEKILAPVWEKILDQLLTYNLRKVGQDVLKGVYQELVDPEDRHDLGEYYTPEWLCEQIVAELLPKSGFPSVLDPTCGSGSFLRAAIGHILQGNPGGGDAMRLRNILDGVVGIDIHPLAVTIAKVTYLLAVRDLVRATKRPIQVPVYLADSLFLPSEVRQFSLGASPTYEIKFGGRSVAIPEELVRAPDLFDPAVAASASVALDHARSGKETPRSLRNYLAKEVPALLERSRAEEMVAALWRFTEELADLVKREENSIWAFIVRNAYRPAMLRERFDFVIGNPPWLSYRYISDPGYQAEVKKRAVEEYEIAPRSQKLMTQMELATVFLVHTLSTFGRVGATLAFVMPRSVLSADQHAKLRDRTYKAPVEIDAYWDLMDVSPVFNVPCCVLFAKKIKLHVTASTGYSIEAVEWEGRLPARDVSWKEAGGRLSAAKKKARVIFLGSRTALSTAKGTLKPGDRSPYAARFRQGATLVPRSFYFVDGSPMAGGVDPNALYRVKTDPVQARDAKPPYQDVVLSGDVEGRFLYATALSKHLLPFVLLDPPVLVLPVERKEDKLEMRTAAELRAAGYRHFARWMEEAENRWKAKREEKAGRQDVYEWLDYQSKLTNQDLSARFLVVYNAAGTHLAAALVDRKKIALPFVVEHKLYWSACESEEEGHYLAAVLNAEAVNQEIKPFQTRGLLGERDIEKKVLELPIPVYDGSKATHRRIAELGRRARNEVLAALPKIPATRSLGQRRSAVRKMIAKTLREINESVSKLF